MNSPGAAETTALRWRWWIALCAIFLVALVLRTIHLRSVLDALPGPILVQDSRFYHARALELLGHDPGESAGSGFTHVGYPYFLAGIYAIAGPKPALALGVQCVLGSLVAVLVAMATLRLFRSPVAASTAGLLYACYDVAIFYDALLLTPSITNALLAVALLCLASAAHDASPRPVACAGVAVGLATLMRSNTLLMAGALALGLAFAWRAGAPIWRRRGALAFSLFVVAVALTTLPSVIQASRASGRLVPLSANGGMNFWIGNNSAAEGVYYQAPFLERLDLQGERVGYQLEARRRTGDPALDLAGASRYWLRSGLREIAEAPARWLRIEARKLFLVWNGFEPRTNVGLEFVRQLSSVLRSVPVGFALLIVAGLSGLTALALQRRWGSVGLGGAYIVGPLLTCTLFFVSGEYRHPISLGLCVGAAGLVALLVGRSRTEELPASRRWTVLGAGALATLVALLPFPELRVACHPRLDYSNHALAMVASVERGTPPRDGYRRALELLARGRENLGTDLMLLETEYRLSVREVVERSDTEAARRAMETATAIYSRELAREIPSYSAPQLRAILLSVAEGMRELAAAALVLEDEGLRRDAALLGGNGYVEISRALWEGRADDARRFSLEALRRAPQRVELQALAGRAMLAAGDGRAGMAQLVRSLEGWPPSAAPAFYLAEELERQGDLAGARRAAEEALRRQPGHSSARALLERLTRADFDSDIDSTQPR